MADTPEQKPPLRWGGKDIAKYLGRTERATMQALERGQIPGARKIGGRWCLSTAEFERHFEESAA